MISDSLLAQNTIRVMSYNILRFPEALPIDRADTLAKILNSYEVDVLGVSELLSKYGSDAILNNALNKGTRKYKAADFTSASRGDLHQMLYYNSDKLALHAQDTVKSNTRDFNKYTLYPITTDLMKGDTIFIDFYVCHLKAGQGSEDSVKRIQNVKYLVKHLDQEGASGNRVLMGDLNLYTDKEEAYQLLTKKSSAYFKDPIGLEGHWHNNSVYKDIFTQSTRSQQLFGEGSGGGVDDRFDFILTSNTMLNSSNEVFYRANTYQAYGNGGDCFNKDITDCAGSSGLLSSLYYMSDHLPVVAEFQLNNAEFLGLSVANVIDSRVWFDENHYLHVELEHPSSLAVFNASGQLVFHTNESVRLHEVNFVEKQSKDLYFIHLLEFGKVIKVPLFK